MRSQDAEILRKRYAYRRLIVRGKLLMRRHTAARMVGPDCAYHLYAMLPQRARPGSLPSVRYLGDAADQECGRGPQHEGRGEDHVEAAEG